MKNKRSYTPYEKALNMREGILIGVSLLLATVFYILGIILKSKISEKAAGITFVAVLSAIGVAILANVIASAASFKKLKEKSGSEMVTYIYSHREEAKKNALTLMKKLNTLLTSLGIYSAFILALGILLAFLSGVGEVGVSFVFISSAVIYSFISRIDYPTPRVFFSEYNGYVEESEYPELYAVAREAEKAVGVKGEIKICFIPDFTAGIRSYGNIISVQIGATLYSAMSREELKSILLHEFAHLNDDDTTVARLIKHHINLTEDKTPGGSLSNLTDLLYKFFDSYYLFNYMLFSYASAIGIEERADQAMVTYGEAKYAGSAFLKLKYYELCNWESDSRDFTPLCANEELSADVLKNDIRDFKARLSECRDFWNKLIDVEIIARSASHPTIKMRLEAIGHTDYSLHESADSESYIAEQKKALDMLDDKLYDSRKERYEDDRKNSYTAPLKDVTDWEEAGKPVKREEYRDIVYALRMLGRVKDAEELCDRAIETLPDEANHYAYFIKGCLLLHAFDESGIEYVYHAIENNHNYITEGMDTIGQFCCICGKQDDLEAYRERAMKMSDEHEEKYSELDTLTAKDNIVAEQLPESIHAGLIALVGSMSEEIDEVYLVRKVITDDFFASAVIVKPIDGIDGEKEHEVMHRIFQYLDTQDWEFMLFSYNDSPMNVIKKISSALIYENKAKDDKADK